MEWWVGGAAGAALFLWWGAGTGVLVPGAGRLEKRLEAGRAIAWAEGLKAAALGFLVPGGVEERIRFAGWNLSPAVFLAWAVRQAAWFGAGGAALALLAGEAAWLLPGALAGAFLGWLWPGAQADKAAQARARAACREAAVWSDLLAVLLQASLQLRQAVERLSREMGGVLGAEFRQAEAAVRAGQAWAEQVEMIPWRVRGEEVAILCTTLAQAERTGAATAQSLLELARQIRAKRAARARARAGEAAVKAVVPLIVCYALPILVVMILPSFVQLLQQLNE